MCAHCLLPRCDDYFIETGRGGFQSLLMTAYLGNIKNYHIQFGHQGVLSPYYQGWGRGLNPPPRQFSKILQITLINWDLRLSV
jgi:hypothetical protein